MSDRLHQQIRQNFDRKSTSELRRVVAERDSGEWSEDAIKVAEELLAERPDEPYAGDSLVENVPIDRRGQAVFELTTSEIAAYRTKIQVLGWLLCIAGALATILLFSPMVFGELNRFSVASGVFGLVAGLFFVLTGVGLIRLDPSSRTSGLVISVILLPFFPIGTIVGVCGVLWLGKRGSVMVAAPGEETKATEQDADDQLPARAESKSS